MYFIFEDRSPVNTKKERSYLLELEQEKWYDPYSKEFISGKDNRFLYMMESDYVYSMNIKNGTIVPALRKNKGCPIPPIEQQIPKLERLIKNCHIFNDNRDKILERDKYKCQSCGHDDYRTLAVHHIVPRSSPFMVKSFIRSAMNVITLCSNCHSKHHYIMKHGLVDEREAEIKRLLLLNGFNMKGFDEEYYIGMDEINEYNKLAFI